MNSEQKHSEDKNDSAKSAGQPSRQQNQNGDKQTEKTDQYKRDSQNYTDNKKKDVDSERHPEEQTVNANSSLKDQRV